ncbi:hypothetical protein [Streptomyces adonidis]|uniref:hypothetical protein n=1 Tax=Streptomyces adonidis TaxID=3231367 RepID=UPI0034DB622E
MAKDHEPVVLLTDRAWPDDSIERAVLEQAGLRLVSGPADPGPAETIEALAAEHQPAAILTCWARVSGTAIAKTSSLRVVARMGVGLDNIDVTVATERGVLEEEPSIAAELLTHPAVVITPHTAFSSDASLAELRRNAAEEVVRVLRGESPRHPCNRPAPLPHGVSS